MAKLPSAKVYSLSVSVSYPGQLGATLGPRTLPVKGKNRDKLVYVPDLCIYLYFY